MNLVLSGINSQANSLLSLDKSVGPLKGFKESVVAGAAPVCPAVTAEAFETLADCSAKSDDLASGHELAIIPTQEKNSEVATVNPEGLIVAAALATATNVNAWGIGATVLHHGVGIMNYAKALNFVGPTMAATKPVQYLAARIAERAAFKAVNCAIVGGVTAGTVASVGFALLSAFTVAEAGVGLHNAFIAKTDADKVSLNPVKLCMKAFTMLTGWGKTAAAA